MIQDSPVSCLPNLINLPHETFLKSIVGDLKRKSAYEGIKTFCQLQLVCKGVKKKVDSCWKEFLQVAGHAALLLPPSQTLDLENAYQFLRQRYPTLKKWANSNPLFQGLIVKGVVVNNSLGNPELWEKRDSGQLARVDLMAEETFHLEISALTNPVSKICAPCIVSSEKWLAICCYNTVEMKDEINVIDIKTKKCCYNIIGIESIMQLQFDNGFLYVLSQGPKGGKLLIYDSNNWKISPKELHLPEEKVLKFYLGNNEFLFYTSCANNCAAKRSQLFAVKKEDSCFSDMIFIPIAPQLLQPCLKVIEGRFFAITPVLDSTSSNPSSLLVELYLHNYNIISRPLKSLSVNFFQIMDFHVQLDRVFTLNSIDDSMNLIVFDLADEKPIKKIFYDKFCVPGTYLRPTLVTPAPDRIQLIYRASRKTPGLITPINGLMSLNYKA